MRRKRVKQNATPAIDFKSDSYKKTKHHIKEFLKSILSQIGLISGRDYWVTTNFLKIKHLKNVTGKIVITLKEVFPVFNFYWENPRMLVWF